MVTQRTVRQVRKVMLWALAALLVVMTVIIGMSTWRVFGTLADVRQQRVDAEASRDALAARTKELGAALDALQTDRGMEAEIRSRYPLVKEGEVEFVFVDKKENGAVDTSTTTRESVWSSFRTWLGL